MQYYEDIENSMTIAIIFDGDEIPMGFQLMDDLLAVMKQAGGAEAPDLQAWLHRAKMKYQHLSRTQ